MILAAAILLLLLAGVLSLSGRPRGLPGSSMSRLTTPAAWLLDAAAAVLVVIAGGAGVAGNGPRLELGDLGGLGTASLRVDALSGLFLVISFGVAVPVLLAGVSPRSVSRPRLPALVALTLGAVLLIMTADHLFVLLFGWELLTFCFYLLSGFDRGRPGRARASVAAATFGKASGGALLLGGLLLAAQANAFSFAEIAQVANGASEAAYALLLLGFGIKVGLVPLQVWLPPAYSAAPGPARAVMAGVAVNAGFYGMWRTLEVLGAPPEWLATAVLLVAGVTAILGIAHAAVHPDLAGLVAWSSVENAGVITAGFGVALVGAASGIEPLVAVGLLAGSLQVIAHSLGKSLLFTSTATIEEATGTTTLEELRGITRRLPWAGSGLVVGSLTLAGLPLTAGFASEWFTLEALMQQFRISSLAMQLASAVAGALVALTVGVAGVTFVRLIALTAFGHPPTGLRNAVSGVGAIGHRAAMVLLALGCLGAAALAPWEVRLVAAGLDPVVGSTGDKALLSPWVLQPVFADFSILSPSWLWIALPALTGLSLLAAWVFAGARVWNVRRVPAWSSASPGVDRGVGYTSFGYANPMRKVLGNLLLTRAQLHEVESAEAAEAEELAVGASQRPRRASTDGDQRPERYETALRYRVDVVEVVERYIYGPLEVTVMSLVRVAKRLQSGRLDAYMTYMLIALVAVLAVVTATS